jgi:hypothetical protein
VPELQLVVVTTSDANVSREGRNTWAMHRLFEDDIVPSFLGPG